MTQEDIVTYLQLSAYLNSEVSVVRLAAKRLIKKAHPNLRPALGLICESKNPIQVIKLMAKNLSAMHSKPSSWPYEGYARPPLKQPLQQAWRASFFSP